MVADGVTKTVGALTAAGRPGRPGVPRSICGLVPRGAVSGRWREGRTHRHRSALSRGHGQGEGPALNLAPQPPPGPSPPPPGAGAGIIE